MNTARRTARSLGGALLSIAGAVLLVVTTIITSAFAFGEDAGAPMTGSVANPYPDPGYVTSTDPFYIAHSQTHPWHPALAGDTGDTGDVEQFGPETGIHNQTFDMSRPQGIADLSTAINSQLTAGNNVVVFGYAQSTSTVAKYFDTASEQEPSSGPPAFLLTDDPNRFEGRAVDRLDVLYTPLLDQKFGSAIPGDVYTTIDNALGYNGAADLPQHPLDVSANLEAVAGIYYLHPIAAEPTPEEIAAGVNEPVSPSAVSTTYIMIPTENLPLLEPLRGVVPAPLLDPGQPPLKVVVELGYNRIESQDGPNPAGWIPKINLLTAITGLDTATRQGVNNALVDAGLPALPDIPAVDSAPPEIPLTDSPPVDTPATVPSILAAAEMPDANAITLPPSSFDLGDGWIPADSQDGFLPGLPSNDVLSSAVDSQLESILSDLPDSFVWPQNTDLDLGSGWPVDPNRPPPMTDFTG